MLHVKIKSKRGMLTLLFISFAFSTYARTENWKLPDFRDEQLAYEKVTGHPRLLLPRGAEEQIKIALKENPKLRGVHQIILRQSDEYLHAEPVERKLIGFRLLSVSQEALKRIFYLSYSYRMTGDEKYLRRAEKEIVAICRFENWNPRHFLDVGEMTMAVALGYDWLYDVMKPEIKKMAVEAIIQKGLDATKKPEDAWFYTSTFNWNAVCNAGILYGTLAIYEEIPHDGQSLIRKCLETNPLALGNYAPDGGYPEGYAYWGYGVSYEVMLIAGLESAFATDFGLSQAPGFMNSGRFIQFMVTPTKGTFSFADTPSGKYSSFDMMSSWFAAKLNDLSLMWLAVPYLEEASERRLKDRLLPALMIFCKDMNFDNIHEPQQYVWHNRGITPLFIYRGGWNKSTDTYFGIKGGSPGSGHAHMDAGSFVYEREAVQWSVDLGKEVYYNMEHAGIDLWGKHQDSERWSIFRLGSTSHSSLTINDYRYCVDAQAEIVEFIDEPNAKGAVVDLTSTLGDRVQMARRRAVIEFPSENLLIEDEVISADSSVTLRWAMCTTAIPLITDEHTIVLTKNGKTLTLTAEEESSRPLRMQIWSNRPSRDIESQNEGTCRVGYEIRLSPEQRVKLKTHLKLNRN